MQRSLGLIFAVLCLIPDPGWADEGGEKKRVEWHSKDLYYYDVNGIMVRLELAPKLLVQFRNDATKDDRSRFLARFSPVAEKDSPFDVLTVIVEFNAAIGPHSLLDTLNEISRSGLAKANPVFFIENMEAVIEGIVVEPKITLTAGRLLERMKRHGDFSVRQVVPQDGSWFFLLDEVKPPLNTLVFSNLIHQDSWVRRAYPRFKFLHDPILASIFVEPVSGTVGERRTVTFRIEVFDPEIELLENQLPQFGAGTFMPTLNGKSPPGYFFEVMGDPVKHPVRKDPRSHVYVTSWEFKHHALGEWTIPSQPVSYSRNGVVQEIRSSAFTLVVNSQIGDLKITDMPYPRSLIHPSEKLTPAPDVSLPPIPSYWFDRWLSRAEDAVRYLRYAAIFLVACAVGLGGYVFVREVGRDQEKVMARRQVVLRIEDLLRDAQADGSYAKYSDALCLMLMTLFPHLSQHPTWEEIKDDVLVSEELGVWMMKSLESTFNQLGRRHSRDFRPTVKSLEEVDGNIRKFLEIKRSILLSGEEIY